MLIFKGLRFPAARTTGRHHLVIPNPTGRSSRRAVSSPSPPRGAAARGRRSRWTRRGVLLPASILVAASMARTSCSAAAILSANEAKQINTVQWFHLAFALRHATQDWLDPDKDGVSHPRAGTSRWHDGKKFLDHQAALSALTQTTLVPAPKGEQVLAIKATTLAAFMVLRAAQALEERRPMQRCLRCGFWFEIRREQRGPRFCSNSCRALHHQRPETAHGLDA